MSALYSIAPDEIKNCKTTKVLLQTGD